MDQENPMDFKALRAKFQDEELLLKQPRTKPALPEKPKVVPPPQSPIHYLPAGARPSLLTSLNQSLEGKTLMASRVVFKDERESKNPLIQTNSQGKDKSEGKLKVSKDKMKGNKEKLNDSSDQKQKRENGKDKKQENTAELVQALPPPKAATPKKKSFLNFKRTLKRDSVKVLADPILDTPSSNLPGLAPLIPVPSEFGDTPPEPEITAPKALMPKLPTMPDSCTTMEITPPSIIPASPDFTPPPAFIPDYPAPKVPISESETPLETETPALSISRPANQNEIIPDPPSTVPTPPPGHTISGPPPVASTSKPEILAEGGVQAINTAEVERPLSQATGHSFCPPCPKLERPISALSALERAEDMSPGKRTSLTDQRILNALDKARKKTASPVTNPTISYSITPPPEEFPLPESPTHSFPELPPIDYEDRMGIARSVKPEQVNGIDHRQTSPVVGITEEESGAVPELLVVPPPPPKKVLPDPKALGPPPEKPVRPPSVYLSEIGPAPVDDNETLAPSEFSETDTIDVPEFDDLASDAHSPELLVSGNGYTGPDTLDGQNPPGFYSNGITSAGTAVHAASTLGGKYQDHPQLESSFPVSHESPPIAAPEAEDSNGIYENTENVYEDISTSATKKKAKTDLGKKRKGPPKNPYAEAAQEANEEKSRTGRFGKGDKKAAVEGLDEKELKKKEKQRLEKEKKELKEKQEREKKEQKEREKKESEMKKKFKITGHEDAMYQAKVTVTTKGRKNDLPVKNGDIVSIIRTTNCPKGKWLARDSSNNCGYVAVDHVELDIKEMLELGKKAAIIRNSSSSNIIEGEVTSTGSRTSNHYQLSAESFTDDSEEWTGDDDETLSPARDIADPFVPVGHTRTLSMPDMGNKELSINHQHSHSDLSADSSHLQARHEALHKLATFFHSPIPVAPAPSITELEKSHVLEKVEAVHLPEASVTQDTDFDHPDLLILPPPDLYADLTIE